MHKDKLVRLVEVSRLLQEPDMLRIDELIPASIRIRLERLFAAKVEPVAKLGLRLQCGEQHLLVVATDQDESAAVREVDELLDAIPRIRPPVDDVAEDDGRILRPGVDHLDERP